MREKYLGKKEHIPPQLTAQYQNETNQGIYIYIYTQRQHIEVQSMTGSRKDQKNSELQRNP